MLNFYSTDEHLHSLSTSSSSFLRPAASSRLKCVLPSDSISDRICSILDRTGHLFCRQFSGRLDRKGRPLSTVDRAGQDAPMADRVSSPETVSEFLVLPRQHPRPEHELAAAVDQFDDASVQVLGDVLGSSFEVDSPARARCTARQF